MPTGVHPPRSQDRAAEATEAWVTEVLAADWVTVAERGLEAVKAHQAKTKAVL